MALPDSLIGIAMERVLHKRGVSAKYRPVGRQVMDIKEHLIFASEKDEFLFELIGRDVILSEFAKAYSNLIHDSVKSEKS
jgi:hypothetical protein